MEDKELKAIVEGIEELEATDLSGLIRLADGMLDIGQPRMCLAVLWRVVGLLEFDGPPNEKEEAFWNAVVGKSQEKKPVQWN